MKSPWTAGQPIQSAIHLIVLGGMLGAYSVAARAQQFDPLSAQPTRAEHGQPEHVRGTVTAVTDTVITIRTTENQTRTITIDAKTMIMRGSAHVPTKDVKVGERIVVDINEPTSVAREIQLGTA